MTTRSDTEGLLREALERWSEFYDEVATYSDGERGMTQVDHGHAEYEVRMDVMAAARAWAATPPDTDPATEAAHYWVGDHGVATGGNVPLPPDTDPSDSDEMVIVDGWRVDDAGNTVRGPQVIHKGRAHFAKDTGPSGPDARFHVETYDARRREVADMIAEADRQDDEPMGPDGLADALMEIAEGWLRAAIQESRAGGGLDVERLARAMHAADAWACVGSGHASTADFDVGFVRRFHMGHAEAIVAEYAALSPSPEPETNTP